MGGFAGYSEGGIVASYWDVETSEQSAGVGEGVGDGVEGKATVELQAPSEYGGIYAGWLIDIDNTDGDFNADTGEDDIWDFGASRRYPLLKADIDGDGVATWGEFGNQEGGEVERARTPLPISTFVATRSVAPLPTSTPTAISTATPLATITPAPFTRAAAAASISTPIPMADNTATPAQTPAVVAVVATATPGDAAAAGGCNSAGAATAGMGAANLLVMLAPLAVVAGARRRRKL